MIQAHFIFTKNFTAHEYICVYILLSIHIYAYIYTHNTCVRAMQLNIQHYFSKSWFKTLEHGKPKGFLLILGFNGYHRLKKVLHKDTGIHIEVHSWMHLLILIQFFSIPSIGYIKIFVKWS